MVLLALAIAAALALSACGSTGSSGSAPSTRTLKLSFLGDPGQPPDPDVWYGTQGLLLTTNTYESLVTFKPGVAKPVLTPALATSWTVSPDNTVFTFTLRKGVTFHDGTPFTSSAIKASFDRRLAVGEGPAYMVEGVKSVTTQGKYKATVTLSEPDSGFLQALASPYGPKMISPTALKAHAGDDDAQTYLKTHDAGTGPYELTAARVGDFYELKAYHGYWGKKPYFTTVDLPVITDSSAQQLQFNSGSLAAILHDLPSSAVESYIENGKFATYGLPTESGTGLVVNPHDPPLTDTATRTALLEAIDTEQLVENAFFGRGSAARQVWPAHITPIKYGTQDIQHNPSSLKAAVESLPSSERSITIGYEAESPDSQQVANLLVAQLSAAGLSVKIQGYPPAQYFGWVGSNKPGMPNLFVNFGFPDAPTPYFILGIKALPEGGVNFFSCSSGKVTKLLEEGKVTGSDDTFSEAAHAYEETGCWMNLVDQQDFMVAQKWLHGVEEAHVVTNPTSLMLNELSGE